MHLPPPRLSRSCITLSDACAIFITNREAAGLAGATQRKYRTFTKQLAFFAVDRGYVMLDQFSARDIDQFWANWKLGPRTKGKRLTMLRAFFRFAVHRKWIAETPVRPDVKAPIGSSKSAERCRSPMR